MKKIYALTALIYFSCFYAKAQITPPYFNDFETNVTGWNAVSVSGSVWQWGVPFNGACSGINVWGIGLTPGFAANTLAYLYSPVFDFTSFPNGVFSFWQMFNTELYQDGTRIEYSIDNGLTWTLLGSAGMPNWYNSFFITSGGSLPGWSGTLLSCQYHSISVDSLNGNATVQFRYVFTSDFSVNVNGFYSVDDFCISSSGSVCNNQVGMDESTFFGNNPFSIFPNPADQSATLSYQLRENESALLRIIDVTGKEIFRKNIFETNTFIDVKTISPGIYFISVEQDGNYEKRKIAIIH